MENWEKEMYESGLSELEMIWISWFISDNDLDSQNLMIAKLLDN
jgi:hypothetical protein